MSTRDGHRLPVPEIVEDTIMFCTVIIITAIVALHMFYEHSRPMITNYRTMFLTIIAIMILNQLPLTTTIHITALVMAYIALIVTVAGSIIRHLTNVELIAYKQQLHVTEK